MKTMFIPLAFIFIFGGCAYFEQQRVASLELEIAEFEANMREFKNSLQGEEDALGYELYEVAMKIVEQAKENIH